MFERAGRAVGSAAKSAGKAIGNAAGAAKDWAGDRIEDADKFLTGSNRREREFAKQRAAEGRPTGGVGNGNVFERTGRTISKAGKAAGKAIGNAAETITGSKAMAELNSAKRGYAKIYGELNKARSKGDANAVSRYERMLNESQRRLAKAQNAYNKSWAGSASNTAATAGRMGKSALKTGKYRAKDAAESIADLLDPRKQVITTLSIEEAQRRRDERDRKNGKKK